MREVSRVDARYNPQALTGYGGATVTPAGAARVVTGPDVLSGPGTPGWGWQNERPLESPPGQDHIERMVNAALPPAPKPQPKTEAKAEAKAEPKEPDRGRLSANEVLR